MGWFSSNNDNDNSDQAAAAFEQMEMMSRANKIEVEMTGKCGFFTDNGAPEDN